MMKSFFLTALFLATANAFTFSTRLQPSVPYQLGNEYETSSVRLFAATKKAATKKTTTKKATTKKAAAKKDDAVETFRKAEFVAAVAEKTGLSKKDSEAALSAVFETITEVSFSFI